VGEAMACGLPAITSVCAGVADYIQDGIDGFVLREPRDAQTLSKLIERLQGEPDLRRKIGEAAARNALLWNWDRPAAAVWERLKDIRTKRSPSDS
jgi:UDP-glucose:(heptosyl)LPS alpha-1,3-glucosyltransferase